MDIAVATAELRDIYHRCKSHSSMRQTLFQNWLLSSMFVAGKRLWGNLTESAGHTGFWYRSRHCWVRAHLEAGVDSSLPLPPPQVRDAAVGWTDVCVEIEDARIAQEERRAGQEESSRCLFC